jgi:hypothetical protein
MRRLPMILASSALCALLSIGCKQANGERCEQHSDCSSGFCNKILDYTASGTGMSESGTCASGRETNPGNDASTTDVRLDTAVASDVGGDATDGASDLASDVAADAHAPADGAPADAAYGASAD